MSDVIKVDVWSDIACPWCYIGKRKFEAGAEGFDVEVEYHSFELSPDTPVDFDGSAADFLAKHKGMPIEQVRPMLAQVTAVAAEVGLDYDYDALQHTNTVKAHQLLHFAKAQGKQIEMKERLLRAYFVEGEHVGRTEDWTRADLAAEIGTRPRTQALRSLESDEYLESRARRPGAGRCATASAASRSS